MNINRLIKDIELDNFIDICINHGKIDKCKSKQLIDIFCKMSDTELLEFYEKVKNNEYAIKLINIMLEWNIVKVPHKLFNVFKNNISTAVEHKLFSSFKYKRQIKARCIDYAPSFSRLFLSMKDNIFLQENRSALLNYIKHQPQFKDYVILNLISRLKLFLVILSPEAVKYDTEELLNSLENIVNDCKIDFLNPWNFGQIMKIKMLIEQLQEIS